MLSYFILLIHLQIYLCIHVLLSQYLDMASYKCYIWEIGICCHKLGGGLFFYFTKPGFLGILNKNLNPESGICLFEYQRENPLWIRKFVYMVIHNAKRVVMITDDQLILLAYKLIKAQTTLKSMGLWIFLVDTNIMELIT